MDGWEWEWGYQDGEVEEVAFADETWILSNERADVVACKSRRCVVDCRSDMDIG